MLVGNGPAGVLLPPRARVTIAIFLEVIKTADLESGQELSSDERPCGRVNGADPPDPRFWSELCGRSNQARCAGFEKYVEISVLMYERHPMYSDIGSSQLNMPRMPSFDLRSLPPWAVTIELQMNVACIRPDEITGSEIKGPEKPAIQPNIW